MIKPEELRIGNLVRFRETRREKSKSIVPNDKTEFQIRGIMTRGRIIGRYNLVWQINMIEGIPLTEEWLAKFGFEKKESEEHYLYGIDEDVYFVRSIGGGMFYFGMHEKTLCLIKSLHQLQNLYFALTGGELILK